MVCFSGLPLSSILDTLVSFIEYPVLCLDVAIDLLCSAQILR